MAEPATNLTFIKVDGMGTIGYGKRNRKSERPGRDGARFWLEGDRGDTGTLTGIIYATDLQTAENWATEFRRTQGTEVFVTGTRDGRRMQCMLDSVTVDIKKFVTTVSGFEGPGARRLIVTMNVTRTA